MYKFRQKAISPKLLVESIDSIVVRGKAREKKEIEGMRVIGTDSRRDEFPDNIQLIHSSM